MFQSWGSDSPEILNYYWDTPQIEMVGGGRASLWACLNEISCESQRALQKTHLPHLDLGKLTFSLDLTD
jgi:hypothetical protein